MHIMMPVKNFLGLVILLLVMREGYGKRSFYAGRRHGVGLVPPPPEPSDGIGKVSSGKLYNFTQPLDHFNSSINITWQQRYQVNDEEYKKGGPFFVMISGEAKMAERWLYYGQMYQNGKKHHAMMFQLEHRFYGLSQPTSDVSIKNLRYLSSLQALADLDAFIKGMKELYKMPDVKVIVFGGSYSGNLVVWYRALYPNTTIGGIASSAPVLAEVDFTQYVETVGQSLKYFNPDCYDAVNQALQTVQDLITARNNTELNSLFGLCGGKMNFDDSYEIETFYDGITTAWMGAVQYNSAGNTSNVANYCRIMTDTKLGTPIDRYFIWYNATKEGDCIDLNYKADIETLKNESWNSDQVQGGSRQWLWQTCTEFAYYQSMDSKNQPFGYRTIDVKYLEDIYCTRPFGITAQEIVNSVGMTNQKYGEKSPNATKVFLLNGSIDPWHPLGIFEKDLNDQSPHRYIEGTSHCYDMHEALDTDPPQLTKARQDVADTLSEWLQESSASSNFSTLKSVLAFYFLGMIFKFMWL